MNSYTVHTLVCLPSRYRHYTGTPESSLLPLSTPYLPKSMTTLTWKRRFPQKPTPGLPGSWDPSIGERRGEKRREGEGRGEDGVKKRDWAEAEAGLNCHLHLSLW